LFAATRHSVEIPAPFVIADSAVCQSLALKPIPYTV